MREVIRTSTEYGVKGKHADGERFCCFADWGDVFQVVGEYGRELVISDLRSWRDGGRSRESVVYLPSTTGDESGNETIRRLQEIVVHTAQLRHFQSYDF